MPSGSDPGTIAILGWGSLIWDPRELPFDGSWTATGPDLPLEFSRRSSRGRLTLVIDPAHGAFCRSHVTTSVRTDLTGAIEDLAQREATVARWIGFVDLLGGRANGRDPVIVGSIRRWCADRGFAAALWTDLPVNFSEQTGQPFSVDNAREYLDGLTGPDRDAAREYIRNAPAEVLTPLRRALGRSEPDEEWVRR